MPKFIDRVCDVCGTIECTASKSTTCIKCYAAKKREIKAAEEIDHLKKMGYTNVEFLEYSNHGKPVWKFVAPCCGKEQSWVFGNILKQQKANGDKFIPCSNCGSKRRTQYALAGYLKNHARTYDLSVYEDYCRRVRMLSDKAFNQNQALLNPNNVKRSVNEWHLDHKVPIIVCFLEGLTIEQAASVKNLQLMDAKNNLSKGKYYFTMEMVDELNESHS